MANQLDRIKLSLRSPLSFLLLAALWALLLLSLSAGDLKGIIHPGSSTAFLHSLRAAFPLAGAVAAIVIILAMRPWRHQQGRLFFGPLGLAAAYGLLGLLAAFRSPDASVALYWAAAYLSVPLVLWAIGWGSDPADRLRLLINFNWLIIFLAVVAFFAWALLYRDLGSLLLNPSALSDCPLRGFWYGPTLRSTGVGRYAAIAAIIALSLLWQPRWRFLSGFLLLASLVLLFTTGARGAIIAFAAGASVIVILHLGKRAIVAGVAALVVLASLAWTTGFDQTLLNSCFARGLIVPSTPQEPVATGIPRQVQIPPGSWALEKLSSEEESDLAVAAQIRIPSGIWMLERSMPRELVLSDIAVQDPLSPQDRMASGAPAKEQVQDQEPAASEAPEIIQIPPGAWALKRVSPQEQPAATTLPSQQASPQEQPAATALPSEQASPQDQMTSGAPAKEQVSNQELASEALETVQVPPLPGEWVLRLVTSDTLPGDTLPGDTLPVDTLLGIRLQKGFFTLTGRTAVWAQGWQLFKLSPLFGFGFHADRLLLDGQHMHNSFMHALVQTGLIGTIPFVGAFLWVWILLFKALRNLARLPAIHKQLVIQAGGVLAFLSLRAIPESTGAFFGADWLLLAPLLLYLQVVNYANTGGKAPA